MARNFAWLECPGSKICSRGWHFDMVAAQLTTILAFVFIHCWFTKRSMGIANVGLETPEYWKTWSAIPVVALRRRNLLPLERFGWLENSCYEYTTLVRIYCSLFVHLRELRWPLLDSDCANACAFNGLPGPMRHWFTGFTHYTYGKKNGTSIKWWEQVIMHPGLATLLRVFH